MKGKEGGAASVDFPPPSLVPPRSPLALSVVWPPLEIYLRVGTSHFSAYIDTSCCQYSYSISISLLTDTIFITKARVITGTQK